MTTTDSDNYDVLPDLVVDQLAHYNGAVGATVGTKGKGGYWIGSATLEGMLEDAVYYGPDWHEVTVSRSEFARHARDAGRYEEARSKHLEVRAFERQLADRNYNLLDLRERIYVWL